MSQKKVTDEPIRKALDLPEGTKILVNHSAPGKDRRVYVTVRNDWSPYVIAFSGLKALSELLSCREINIRTSVERGGCPTCDYGTVYEATFECWDFCESVSEEQ